MQICRWISQLLPTFFGVEFIFFKCLFKIMYFQCTILLVVHIVIRLECIEICFCWFARVSVQKSGRKTFNKIKSKLLLVWLVNFFFNNFILVWELSSNSKCYLFYYFTLKHTFGHKKYISIWLAFFKNAMFSMFGHFLRGFNIFGWYKIYKIRSKNLICLI